ncbi:amino acid ABC transporter substrate-binding protein [Propionivibrio sp.]|uniref:amino acid ABC transporter substrate-binding protein n=1 Tax=Propionivibrio sp. TaxID=2212460 RepID=UPI00260FAA0C|nr:amino acid ABC transporter substrate-binding protein [Propionivibrio sp.]
MLFRPLLITICLLLGAGTLNAQETKSPTLEKIRSYGAVYVGHRETSIPFSYLDADGKVIGYSMDLCGHIIEAIKTRLALPRLEIVPVPTTPDSRQMMLEAGPIDLSCDSATNTIQRQRYVGFSVTTFAAGIKALVRKDSRIRSFGDLKGKVVVTTSGTTSDSYVKAAAARQGLLLNYRFGRDHDDSLRQLLNGQADVMVLDDVLLHGLLMSVPQADAFKLLVLAENFAVEPYGIMFRRNDPQFKKLVDDTLIGLMKSGEFAHVYDKWFVAPIPPTGKSLNLPMSDLLRQLTLTPNDRGV